MCGADFMRVADGAGSLFQSKDEPEGAKGRRSWVLSFLVLYLSYISSLGRGGGNVEIASHDLRDAMLSASDFQGLWEGRETGSSFSGLSINRHFLCPPSSALVGDSTRFVAGNRRAWFLLFACVAPRPYR